MVKVSCSSILDFFSQLDEDLLIEESSILNVLAVENCLGRRALANITGFSERKVREAIDRLLDKGFLTRRNDLCVNSGKPNVFTTLNIKSQKIDSRVLTIVCCFNDDILEMIRRRVVELRDHMVILTGRPWIFEIVGIHDKGETMFPGVPSRVVSKYKKYIEHELSEGSLIILWKDCRVHINESILLISLFKLCASNKPG